MYVPRWQWGAFPKLSTLVPLSHSVRSFLPAGYGVLLAEFTIDQQLHIGLRQLASVMLKQYVNDCWADGGDVVEEGGAGDLPAIDAGATPALLVNDEAKRRIKQILPEGLYDQNSKVSCSRL